jgi:P-type Ca2+ transporter type 2C
MIPDDTNIVYHSAQAEEIETILKSNRLEGLSQKEAELRLKNFGKNILTQKKRASAIIIFLHQFKSPIVLLLALAALLSIWINEWLDAIAIIVVTFINAFIGFYMEFQAEQTMKALKKISRPISKVIRDKHLVEIPTENIVIGDIIYLESGDLVPADGRLFKSSMLQSDESSLTGESFPVDKQLSTLPKNTSLAERSNMLYKGTSITKGNGHIIVTQTGMHTELGKVADLVDSENSTETPLEKKLQVFSKKLIFITIALVILIFFAGILNGLKVIDILQTSIAMAVAAIPEGLPIVATIALAHGMLRMAKHQVIVKKLSAVETLGGTNVICTDKTGTLTKNKIEVSTIISAPKISSELIKNIAILCNTADLNNNGAELKEIGDPLETALLKYFSENPAEIAQIREQNPKIKEEPFTSEKKMMATMHQTDKGVLIYAKGAVETILAHVTHIDTPIEAEQTKTESKQYWLQQAELMAKNGMRVIALGYKQSEDAKPPLLENLTFAGIIGMIDPPREEVLDAIEECHSAGINIIMVTGDHPSTAQNIALRLKITNSPDAGFILGQNMKPYDELTDQDKEEWLRCKLFARVSPLQKLDIVKAFQEKEFVVGMTGDGINDAPALKKADIGIAIGINATQVAQEVADMIVKDNSFTAIVLAVKQGRIIFDNIRKFVIFLLSCNLSELLVIAIAAILNLNFQLLPIQILFINIVTDVLPALALGITEGSPGIMKILPRPESEPIINRKHWWTIGFYSTIISLSSIGAVLASQHIIHPYEPWQPKMANNILFFTLIFSQLLHVLNMGSSHTNFFRSEVFQNKYVWFAILGSILLLVILYNIEAVRSVLYISAMPLQDWLLSIAAGFVSLLLIQISKSLKLVTQ